MLPSPDGGRRGDSRGRRALRPARRDQLSWFESKPLFGWKVLVPRTKEQAASLSDQLRSYGAVPQRGADHRGGAAAHPAADGAGGQGPGRRAATSGSRFTSVNAVKAVREKFEEYGLDARAFAGIKVAGRGRADGARRWSPSASSRTWCRAASSRPRACWRTGRPTTRSSTRSTGCFLPRADIATETLVAGLIELGWEVDDVTAYRTVRASPPPAETREAIKGGGFDAVLFTSSSTVRNLVGIAGKPHNVHGDRRASARRPPRRRRSTGCGSTSWPRSRPCTKLAEALADFGLRRRAAALEAG